ncbi:hypothetical protein HPTD01_737 [Halomonas sp. TD01]|nr:hypothetical protein HPTD01_737 [Halomonas sp. TD01]
MSHHQGAICEAWLIDVDVANTSSGDVNKYLGLGNQR